MGKDKEITLFSTEEMLQELSAFDPVAFKYYYESSQKQIKEEIIRSKEKAKRYGNIVEYEKSHQFSCLTKRNYDDDYENLNLVYGEREDTLRNINLMELVLNKWISQYINIDGMERLFSETYIEFEWEMHLSADYKKHNMEFYRDHFFHQVKDTYMMYRLLKDHGFYERIKEILLNGSESKISRYVSRSLEQQRYYETNDVRELRGSDKDFYIRNMIYMATFMAGLFHDIGYPEGYYKTTSRHIRDYIASIHELNADMNGINRIYSLLQNSLLFRVESFNNIESRLMSTKAEHGTLSAIIFLLHFYENGAIYNLSPYKKAAVELAALAIYNHTNKYGIQGEKEYSMYKPCFVLNPISWLLRICDDLQEWERLYFVISDKSNIVICNQCKTPVIGFREKDGDNGITRYRCSCQFLSDSGDKENDNRDADKQIQAFDGNSKFPYRRIYNVSVCDKVEIKNVGETGRKLLCRLHYDPYKLLHVVYLNKTYAKHRISELNQLKKLLDCQRGIPQIFLEYFVTSNPIHIKVKMLEEYIEHRIRVDKKVSVCNWRENYISKLKDQSRCPLDQDIVVFDNWLKDTVTEIVSQIGVLKNKFLDRVPEGMHAKMEAYVTMSIDFYASLLVYQWTNQYLNNYKNESYKNLHQIKYYKRKKLLLQSEWTFAQEYFRTTELRCLIEDCFLQFTRMYLDITQCDVFPKDYYKQYENGKREEIFNIKYIDESGKEVEEDIAADKRYFEESEEYYYKALVRYLDPSLYYPITMLRKEGDKEIDVVKEKLIDAYTDLYLFYLMDQEIKVGRK